MKKLTKTANPNDIRLVRTNARYDRCDRNGETKLWLTITEVNIDGKRIVDCLVEAIATRVKTWFKNAFHKMLDKVHIRK